jgi:hypothetical protein
MSAFKPYKELTVLKPVTAEGVYKLTSASGHVYAEVASEEDAYRFADCWNACRKLAFPEAHINATDEHAKRTEKLRKEAWARAEVLQTELDHLKAPTVSA